MLVIIEGFDNSGKTTLVNWLLESLNSDLYNKLQTYHSTPDVDQYKRLFEITNAIANGYVVICDRIGIVGEQVYGTILRNCSVFDQFGYKNMWKLFLGGLYGAHDWYDIPIYFFWCNPSGWTMGDKDEMEGVRENQSILKTYYDVIMGSTQQIFTELREEGGIECYFNTWDYCTDPDKETVKNILGGYLE